AWTDLQPNATGSGLVYYEENGSVATITYDGVYGWGTTATNTLQFTYDSSNANWTLEFGALSTTNPENWVVGYSPAGPSTDDGGSDLSALASALVSPTNIDALALGVAGAPVSTSTSGSTLTYTASNMIEYVPGVTIGMLVLSVTQANPGLPLGFLGAPGCRAYSSGEVLATAVTDSQGRADVTYSVPNNPTLLNFELYQQYAVLSPINALGLALTNGVRLEVGSY
ncbi:MAG: hypothetical protein KAI24_17745, partial [Planctomycetes bacterium]|nr:hypothetical protein [Planctomycetota bacterium]